MACTYYSAALKPLTLKKDAIYPVYQILYYLPGDYDVPIAALYLCAHCLTKLNLKSHNSICPNCGVQIDASNIKEYHTGIAIES